MTLLWIVSGIVLTLLIGYIIHTLFSSDGSDYEDNSFDAFVDKTSSLSSKRSAGGDLKSKFGRYERSYEQPGCQILIIYGTEYGFSKELARELFDRIDVLTSEIPLQPRIVNAKNFSVVDIMQETCVFVMISTAGDGVTPTDARDFVSWLSSIQLDLSHLCYSVLALGDSNYVHFCRTGKTVDHILSELGAKCIKERKDVDAEDRESIENWFNAVTATLNDLKIEIKYDYLQMKSDSDSSMPSREKPFWSTLQVKHNLTKNSESDDKETIHCEFDISNSGLEWVSGDALGIYPENNPTDVEAFLKAIKLSGSELVQIPKWAYQPQNADVLPLRMALQRFYDLKIIKAELLLLLQKHSPLVGPCAHRLNILLNDGVFKTNTKLNEYLKEREVVDVLEDFRESASLVNISDLLQCIKSLMPRYYSISSSPVVDRNTVCVTAAVVRYKLLGKDRTGVTTTFLQDMLTIGHSCPVFMSRNPNFRLPLDGSLPVIMIGPGTGLAPFRAFIQERIATHSSGFNLLYFGCRQKNQDFLYRNELEHWVETGKLDLRTAFSRDQLRKIYVQDLIREDSERIWHLLSTGAHIYVCGDARHMAHDVHQALLDIVMTSSNGTHLEAEQFLSSLELKGCYEKDVWVT